MIPRQFFVLLIVFLLLGCSHWSAKNQKQAQLYLQLGASQFENGDYPNSLKNLLIAEEKDPKNIYIQNMLGLVYFIRQKYELSEKHFQKALTLNPKFTEARNNLSRLYIEQKKFELADRELQIVLNDLTYSDMPKAQINWGLSKFYQKQYPLAEAAFRTAINEDSSNCLAYNMLGRTYFEIQNYQESSRILDRAIGFCMKILFDEPHYFSALSYYRLGEVEKSKSRFNEVVSLYPSGQYNEKARSMLSILQKVNYEKNR